MAYEDRDAYSRANHRHDYSKVSVESFNTKGLGRDKSLEQSGELSILARINIDGVKTNINALGAFQPDPPPVDIGTLLFVAYKTLSPIDENAEDFDGYVYPDGRVLKTAEFPEAYASFGNEYKLTSDGDDEFRIPTLSDFICLNPMTQTSGCCRRNNFQNGIKSHTHEWRFKMQGVSKAMKVKVGVGGANTNQGGIHKGDLTSQKMTPNITDAQVRLSSDNLLLDNDFDAETAVGQITETESTPNYMLLPVLMYIGKKSDSATPSPSPTPSPTPTPVQQASIVDEQYTTRIADEEEQTAVRSE